MPKFLALAMAAGLDDFFNELYADLRAVFRLPTEFTAVVI